MTVEKIEGTAESFEFKAEIQQLLNILVHSLYTEREIFLRELLSNAADALNRVQFELLTDRELQDADAELAIRLSVDEEAGTLTISDTGIGMTRAEIVQDLGTIAHSGAAAFLKRLREEKRPSVEMIGQFGVGFYSVFMVADRVQVFSRSYRAEAEAVEWESDGGSEYQVSETEKEGRGTDIVVHLKEDAVEFASEWRLEQIIRRHSDFVPFPIYVGDRAEPINRRMALWRQSPTEVTDEQYAEFYKHLTMDFEDPRLHVHLVSDAPVNLRSILYIPSRRDRGVLDARVDYGLQLYIHNVLIQEHNKDLLPPYLRFVEGVVESEDLPLNISREAIQSSPVTRRIRRALVRKLVRELESLAEDEPETYDAFWRTFGLYLKEGIASDPRAKEDLESLLVFYSSKSEDKLVSLAEYVQRMHDGQQHIYYVLGEDLKTVDRSPHLDYFKDQDIEVLYLVDPVDSLMVLSLTEYDGVPLKSVDQADLELPSVDAPDEEHEPAVSEAEFNRLVGRFVKVLGDRVLEVRESKVLRNSPCRLVSPEDAPDQGMSRVYRLLDREFQVPKRILEINRVHPIMINLARLLDDDPEAKVIDPAVEQLYENQLLVEGLHPNPTEMVPRIQQLVQHATDRDHQS
ncbi:MAG: molecular chaperone HtpG [Anaerolineae bacterium]